MPTGGRPRRSAAPGSPRAWAALDPVASRSDQRAARAVFDPIARQYAARGAAAVVLGGSWARGEAHRASDIDIWVLGGRCGKRTVLRDGFPVNVERTTVRAERRKLAQPATAGSCVPGWRTAFAVYDPQHVARGLIREARRFRWSAIAPACDRWVAVEVVGLAEEAVKLLRALGRGSRETAAVQRNLLANHLAIVLAVHRRWLWGTENELWERLGRDVGGAWERTQRAALGTSGNDFESSCRAALDLYLQTADAVARTFRPEQVGLVERVRSLLYGDGRSGPPAASGSAVLGQ